MVAYLHEHLFDEGLNVEDAKRDCGIRDNSFSGRFAYHVGCAIKKHINTHRLRAAKQVMRHPNVKIIEVALALGYSNQGALTMAFQRQEGCCPSAFRARQRNVKRNVKDFVKQTSA